jgi:hypothetical protein
MFSLVSLEFFSATVIETRRSFQTVFGRTANQPTYARFEHNCLACAALPSDGCDQRGRRPRHMTNFAISKDNNGARLDQGGQKKSRNRAFQHAQRIWSRSGNRAKPDAPSSQLWTQNTLTRPLRNRRPTWRPGQQALTMPAASTSAATGRLRRTVRRMQQDGNGIGTVETPRRSHRDRTDGPPPAGRRTRCAAYSPAVVARSDVQHP